MSESDAVSPNVARNSATLVAELAEAERCLRHLESEKADLNARVMALRAEVEALAKVAVAPRIAPANGGPEPLSKAGKLKLFRELFRGGDGVYPVRFESRTTGKSGYAPDCSNKFIRGVCDLPKVVCALGSAWSWS